MKALLWIYSSLFFLLVIVSSAWAIKPTPPLTLSLHQTKVSEEGSRVTLIATAHDDLSRVELSVALSPGLLLVKGDEKWEGALKKGEKRRMEWMIQNPGNARRTVTGKGTAHLDDGLLFVQKATMTLNGETQSSP